MLTDLQCRSAKAKPDGKPNRLTDGNGLYLEVTAKGGKYWRRNYRRPGTGKQNTLSFGLYPTIGLEKARKKNEAASQMLADNVDPAEAKKTEKRAARLAAASSFETVAREWFEKMKPSWAESHSSKILARLENDVFPWLGKRTIAEIEPIEIYEVIQRIEKRTLDTAHRAKQNIGQVFRYAVATGRATRDATADLRGALPPLQQNHFATITDPPKAASLLRAIDTFDGTFVVHCALKLAPLFFVRPGELRKAKWTHMDLDKGEWQFPVSKVRKGHPARIHIVPLARQAVAILKELQPLTGQWEHVFPGARDKKRPMSDGAVNAALRRMGYDTQTEITGHGFRSMARTILREDELLMLEPEYIERQLAHKTKAPNGTAYDKTQFLKQRREMMQKWADYLDRLKAGAQIIPIEASH
jgi:integrase